MPSSILKELRAAQTEIDALKTQNRQLVERLEGWVRNAVISTDRADRIEKELQAVLSRPVQLVMTSEGLNELAAKIAAYIDPAKLRVN